MQLMCAENFHCKQHPITIQALQDYQILIVFDLSTIEYRVQRPTRKIIIMHSSFQRRSLLSVSLTGAKHQKLNMLITTTQKPKQLCKKTTDTCTN